MNETQFNVSPNSNADRELLCPISNEVLTGGGVTLLSQVASTSFPPVIMSSGPVNAETWDARVSNPDLVETVTYGEWVICAIAS
jgi:hypothetical protein